MPSKLHPVVGCDDNQRTADIIFVHGLNPTGCPGEQFAFETWGGEKSDSDFWLRWLYDDSKKEIEPAKAVGIWVLEYEATASAWLGNAMPLSDRANNILDLFIGEYIGDKPIIFVCHSLGGLVVKEILHLGLTHSNTQWRQIAEQIRGIVFLSTPHVGADFATFINNLRTFLRLNAPVQELVANSALLRALSEWYRDAAYNAGIVSLSYGETIKTHGVLVVDQVSANPHVHGQTTTMLDKDHSGMAKLQSRSDQPYKSILRFVRDCLERTKPIPPSHSTSPVEPHTNESKHLPPKNSHFTGRNEDINALRNSLVEGGTAAVVQAISGLGGVGKTALAVEYAYRYHDDYDNIFFTDASDLITLERDYRKMAADLGIDFPQESKSSDVARVIKGWLNTHGKYLLILDNADFHANYTVTDLRDFLPEKPQGHLLVTSRAQTFSGSLGIKAKNVLRLNTMSKLEGQYFLIARVYGEQTQIENDEKAAAEQLAEKLDGLPLALEQAAAYIVAKQSTFGTYATLFDRQELKLLERASPETGNYTHTVSTTWAINFEEVQKLEPAAADFLTLCAIIAPDNISIR